MDKNMENCVLPWSFKTSSVEVFGKKQWRYFVLDFMVIICKVNWGLNRSNIKPLKYPKDPYNYMTFEPTKTQLKFQK